MFGKLAVVAMSIAMAMFASDARAGGKYVGVDGCKMCHKAAKTGDQFGAWQKGPHAKAYQTLASAKAKEVAAKAGVTGDPQKADKCLKCHVTGAGLAASSFGPKYKVEDGVGCESCHGAGDGYKAKKTMEDHDAAVAAGLIVPTEKVCTGCHNKSSPTFKPFNFEERAKKIAHKRPK